MPKKLPKDEQIARLEQQAHHMAYANHKGRVPSTTEEENKRYLAHSMELMAMSKIDLNDPNEVMVRSQDYYGICYKNGMKPNAAGYVLSLGYSRQYINDVLAGRKGANVPQETKEIILRFKDSLASQMEDYMQNGKINPIAGIFLMKNNHGYRDQVEQVTVTESAESRMSAEQIAAKYKDMPDD